MKKNVNQQQYRCKYSSLSELLHSKKLHLFNIRNKYHILNSINNEIDKRLEYSQELFFLDDCVYNLLIDSSDMLIIDLCAFGNGLICAAGLIPQISRNFSIEANNGLKTTFKNPMSDVPSSLQNFPKVRQHVYDRYNQNQIDFKELFGNNSLRFTDVEKLFLSKKIKKKIKHLDADRNQNRAHKYESDNLNENQAKRLNLKQAEELLLYFEELIYKLHGLFFQDYRELQKKETLSRDSKESAKDIVDILTNGSICNSVNRLGISGKYYEEQSYAKIRAEQYKRKTLNKNLVTILNAIKEKIVNNNEKSNSR